MATAGTSYSTMQSLAAQMAKSSNETHTVSPLDELMALKTLKDMAADKNDEALWQQYIDDSTRMLRLAAFTIQSQPAISEKLGVSGLQGVLALASILKQKHSDQVLDGVLTTSLAAAAPFGLEPVGDRITRLGRGGRAFDYANGGKILLAKQNKVSGL